MSVFHKFKEKAHGRIDKVSDKVVTSNSPTRYNGNNGINRYVKIDQELSELVHELINLTTDFTTQHICYQRLTDVYFTHFSHKKQRHLFDWAAP